MAGVSMSVKRTDKLKRTRKKKTGSRMQGRIFGITALLLVGSVGMISFRQKNIETFGRVNLGFGTQAGNGKDLLLLVNKTHKLPDDYEVELHWLENGSCAVAEEMYGALREMLTDGSNEGLNFVVASGYRDADFQRQLLDEDIAAAMATGLSWQEAYDQETLETMPPGYSEHGTGLAVDLTSADYQILDAEQEFTAENQWLRENCSKYGFILRYPKGKEEITHIHYEPWHFRYVGKKAAGKIMRRGVTLEEYLGEEGL